MNEKEAKELVKRAESNAEKTAAAEAAKVNITTASEVNPSEVPDSDFIRNILVIGCGDGGAHIAATCNEHDSENNWVVLYNTLRDTLLTLPARYRLFIEDDNEAKRIQGTGKDRDLSKQLFKDVYQSVIDTINIGLEEKKQFNYAVICTTADGGTGSGMSVVLAKLIQANYDIPVIILGVYPAMGGDAQGYSNALMWTKDVVDSGIPYIILDNDRPDVTDINEAQEIVNNMAAKAVCVLNGAMYNTTNIKQIDTQNLLRLTHGIGGRLVIVSSDQRPTTGQTLDDYIGNLIKESCQPDPIGCSGIGLWIKGPKELRESMNIRIPEIQKKFGMAELKFDHIEDSSLISISAIFTGCHEPSAREAEIRHGYDDIMDARKTATSTINDYTSGIKTGSNTVVRGTKKRDGEGLDLSAFDD